MSAICIIPARGGSKRIPRKNVREFHGKPILTYAILAAKNSYSFHSIWISTDDAEVADIGNKMGIGVIWRPQRLADDNTGTQEVMAHAIKLLPDYEFACCLYPTVPLLNPGTLSEALRTLSKSEFEYIVPVSTWLRDPGQFYMGRSAAFKREHPLIGMETGMIRIDPKTDCDINTMDDWFRAERMYAELSREAA